MAKIKKNGRGPLSRFRPHSTAENASGILTGCPRIVPTMLPATTQSARDCEKLQNRRSTAGDNDIHPLQRDEQPAHHKRLSPDTALTALARLGVLQLGGNRAFVSIIDEANQHVIAEATASVSLRNVNKHQSNDGLYLGTRSLHLGWGVVPHAIKFFTNRNPSTAVETDNLTANSSRYVVHDLSQEDAYQDRPYVVSWPSMRFYAAVPVRSPGGYVLGSYCMVDNKPRSDFGDTEVETMQEIADAIAQHLEAVRLSHCHWRTEKLVESLTTFVKGHAEFDPTEPYKSTNSRSISVSEPQAGRGQPSKVLNDSHLNVSGTAVDAEGSELHLRPLSSSEGTAELASLFSKVTSSEQTELSAPPRFERSASVPSWNGDESRDTVAVPRNAPAVADSPMNDDTQPSATDIANRISKIFSRASVLLRDSMDLDGILFADASRCNAGVVLANDTGTWEPLPSTLNPGFLADPYPSPLDIPGVGSLSKAAEHPCVLLGRALRDTTQSASPHCNFNITDQILDDLMANFPRGQIFDLCALRSEEWSFQAPEPVRDLCRQLARHFPGATSILFSPIWDWNKSRWLAGTLVWTSNTFRALGADELHYFKVFGDSIISEVARVDWTTTQQSKSAFMSSVSHELRSPLHGILASAELLGATSLPPQEQQHLVNMVEACGMTLLDTLNHLLDFSGINNLTTLDDSPEVGMTSLETTFDLGDLVEEVVEVQYTGQKLPKAAAHLDQSPVSPSLDNLENKKDEVSVIVRVEDATTWKIQSVPGAWKRIVMNVLGNSLKWTKAGFIEVSLSKVRRKRDPLRVFVLLSVTDTGSGIAADFLRHKLFCPFAQENALSEGLGLGLSIVRQLVASLDGHVNVRSEVGVGTQVDIIVPVEMPREPPSIPPSMPMIDEHVLPSVPVRACLIGFDDYPGLGESPTGILPPESKRKLAIRSCLTAILAKQPGWSVSSSESFINSEGDIAIIEEAKLMDILKDRSLSIERVRDMGFTKIFIMLNSKTPDPLPIQSSNVIRVSQPFGYRKFRNAVIRVQEILQNASDDSPCQLLETIASPDLAGQVRAPILLADVTLSQAGSTTTQPIIEPIPPLLEVPTSLNLLIVDDNEINLKILATFARKIGCTYDTAADGLIALQKYKESRRPYDLILMDISMPVMDGIVSTSEIRLFEEERNLSRSRIMAVTGVASTDMQQRAKAAGIDDYLVKPVSLAALKKVIAAL
ncbi:hypothetical protein BJX63DRAFT_439832 [Aspergillus granulosus]|uniref:histidine kinase n=1 Tax=Aspergillus granulosus TaxID=176169 RepID=A0ABR4GZ10_9EURO